jgi:hypothetical protein
MSASRGHRGQTSFRCGTPTRPGRKPRPRHSTCGVDVRAGSRGRAHAGGLTRAGSRGRAHADVRVAHPIRRGTRHDQDRCTSDWRGAPPGRRRGAARSADPAPHTTPSPAAVSPAPRPASADDPEPKPKPEPRPRPREQQHGARSDGLVGMTELAERARLRTLTAGSHGDINLGRTSAANLAGRLPAGSSDPYLTVIVPTMPAARWPSTVQ